MGQGLLLHRSFLWPFFVTVVCDCGANHIHSLCSVVFIYLLSSTLGGKLSSTFVPRSGTKGLWSVSINNFIPRMYVENFSHAHVTAKASFSIWAHLLSVSVNGTPSGVALLHQDCPQAI